MSSKTSKNVYLLIVLALLISIAMDAKADFIFGTPENLGPTVNSSSGDGSPSISSDGLELYFGSLRGGWSDIWVTRRESTDDNWGEPIILSSKVNNSAAWDSESSISADGLELYFASDRTGGTGGYDLWVTRRATTNDAWGTAVNLGPDINTSVDDTDVCISADGLSLYIESYRNGGHGSNDLWVTNRATTSDPWGELVNLGSIVNSSASDGAPSISTEGLVLFFSDHPNPRPGGNGSTDIWMMRRPTTSDPWGEPINLGPTVNSSSNDQGPNISSDGSTLYFFSRRSGGYGDFDLWQVSIEPVCDFNNDLKVDSADMHIMVDHWGESYPLCDIGPTPLGDGIVDIQDMIVLAEHLYQLTAHWKLDETDGGIAYDSFGDYDGTINGNPSWLPAAGIKGGSLMLDGIDDYIDIPFILDPSKGSFSVFAWVYSWMPDQVIISQKGQSGGTWLGIDSSGKLMTEFSESNFVTLVSETVITDIQWHHVGFVYDMDTLHRQIYVDGILVAEDATAVYDIPSDGGLYIGASKDLGTGTLFSGFIDDVRIYNQALTSEEIAALAQ
jgi:hypothetical protein